MNKFFNAAKIFVTGIFLCGILLIGGKASAEVNQEAMEMFRETLAQTSKQDDRIFHQDILFIMPKLTGELEFLGATENDTFKLRGLFNLWTSDEDGNFNNVEKPFYITQDKDNMVVYFQEDKKWKKITTPTTAANAANTVMTPDEQELQMMTEFVKDVTILQDNDKQRTLLIKVDGEKLANAISTFSDQLKDDVETNNNNTENPISNALYKEIKDCVNTGFKNADIWFTWTVDKVKWQTTTASFNLSGLPQSIATAALNNPTISNLGVFNEILETVAFYSEFKGYTTFLNPKAKSQMEIPKNALKAKEVKVFEDDDKDAKSKKK